MTTSPPLTLKNKHRPVWICGPFQSPYSSTFKYDNLLLVASGIGITPALSVLATHKSAAKGVRTVSMIWICRDPTLIEFHLGQHDFDPEGFTLIYYTGKKKLELPSQLEPNVRVIFKRPSLESLVPALIDATTHGTGLTETDYKCEIQGDILLKGAPGGVDETKAAGELSYWLREAQDGHLTQHFMAMAPELKRSVATDILETWCVLYCGGSQKLVDILRGVSSEIGIRFKVEKFNW